MVKKELICIECGHPLWLPGVHNTMTGECDYYSEESGCCGCVGGDVI